ncbi:hypothetical protein BH11BAC7_BH11BAC7_02940 [soil metagenome]
MKTKSKKSSVDSEIVDPVKMMRDIRESLAAEIMGMTFEEEKKYLKKLLSKG